MSQICHLSFHTVGQIVTISWCLSSVTTLSIDLASNIICKISLLTVLQNPSLPPTKCAAELSVKDNLTALLILWETSLSSFLFLTVFSQPLLYQTNKPTLRTGHFLIINSQIWSFVKNVPKWEICVLLWRGGSGCDGDDIMSDSPATHIWYFRLTLLQTTDWQIVFL